MHFGKKTKGEREGRRERERGGERERESGRGYLLLFIGIMYIFFGVLACLERQKLEDQVAALQAAPHHSVYQRMRDDIAYAFFRVSNIEIDL